MSAADSPIHVLNEKARRIVSIGQQKGFTGYNDVVGCVSFLASVSGQGNLLNNQA